MWSLGGKACEVNMPSVDLFAIPVDVHWNYASVGESHLYDFDSYRPLMPR
jgi:hypothetical protein